MLCVVQLIFSMVFGVGLRDKIDIWSDIMVYCSFIKYRVALYKRKDSDKTNELSEP